MKSKDEILKRMELYRVQGGGIGSWLTKDTRDEVFERLGSVDSRPLRAVQLNQLLVLAHEAPVSDGFFQYYWLEVPPLHPYDVRSLPDFSLRWPNAEAITSLDHLAWGLYRLYVDGLLYFGNVRTAFRTLRNLSALELREYFTAKRVDTAAIRRRGPPLPLRSIAKDQRYLIAETACKSYGDDARVKSDLRSALVQAYESHTRSSGGVTTIGDLLANHLPSALEPLRKGLAFSASEVLKGSVASMEELEERYQYLVTRFTTARSEALLNTDYYLSMLTDLDVYVATSMRTPEDFVKMAETCEALFADRRLRDLNLRFFDPTLSAADGHEDKGLIECLMVKCAKALVYCAGTSDSYGKAAEAAMALSLGRPVIFFCEERGQFYRDVHPLTRLIHFETGVAVGAMVATTIDEVAELLFRTFENRMVYQLERSRTGSLRLVEQLSNSVVRLQTSNTLLTETFWNHYHQDRYRRPAPVTTALPVGTSQPAFGAPPQASQGQLELGDTTSLVRRAARSSSVAEPGQEDERARLPSSSSTPEARTSLPMSTKEVFDGISTVKTSQPTGARRFTVFDAWLATEGVGIVEGLKLLRFVEATLAAAKSRPGFVYTKADLTRWFREMSDGEVVGTVR